MKLVIGLVLALVVVGVIAVMQMVRANHFETQLVEVEKKMKDGDTACTHLAQEVRSTIRLPNDHETKVGDDGTITISNKQTGERWVFPPNGLYQVHTPTR